MKNILSKIALFVCMIVLSACGMVAPAATPTATATESATATPANTSTPTLTPTATKLPTWTPDPVDVALAQRKDLMFVEIQKYQDTGYLENTKGEYTELADYEQNLAKIANYQWLPLDLSLSPATFVLSAHFKWSAAKENANLSACGFVFGGHKNGAMAVFLDRKNAVLLDYSGKFMPRSRRAGSFSFKHSDEADFTLIVNNLSKKVFVLINDEFNVEYDLRASTNYSRGYIGYAVISGTNTDYGTRCEITNARLWRID